MSNPIVSFVALAGNEQGRSDAEITVAPRDTLPPLVPRRHILVQSDPVWVVETAGEGMPDTQQPSTSVLENVGRFCRQRTQPAHPSQEPNNTRHTVGHSQVPVTGWGQRALQWR